MGLGWRDLEEGMRGKDGREREREKDELSALKAMC